MGRAFEYRRAAKEKRWDKMSKVFPKLAKAITVAVKEGGPDPEMNAKLRTAIQNAKAENMPKDNIERAINKGSGADGTDYIETTYEGYAPHGVAVFVETTTAKRKARLRPRVRKFAGCSTPELKSISKRRGHGQARRTTCWM